MNAIAIAACAAALALPTLAAAQAPSAPPAGVARFRAFFAPLAGTWTCEITDRDPSGKVEYHTLQLRGFAFTIGGAFVRETALVRTADGRRVEAGIHLYGYDPAKDRVVLHGFWGGTADRMVLVEARIEGDGGDARLVGTMRTDYPDGRRVTNRSEMKWEAEGRFVWRTYDSGSDGRETLNEELVYTVTPIEVLPARH